MKKTKKVFDNLGYYITFFYFAFLPAFGLFYLSYMVVSLIKDNIPSLTPYGEVIVTLVYAFLTLFTWYMADSKSSKLFRKLFLISSLIIILMYFIGALL